MVLLYVYFTSVNGIKVCGICKQLSVLKTMFCNAGFTVSCLYDSYNQVNDRALFHIDNSYKIPNLHVTAHQCKTNIPSNTAFRGYGAPQSMFVMEAIISEIASSLKIPPEQVISYFSCLLRCFLCLSIYLSFCSSIL